jgi:hypothetical protein
MKKYKILDIQSVSDIITNSSSEVFVINSNNDALKELIQKLNINDSYYLTFFETEDDVKKFLLDECHNYDCLSELDGFIDCNVLRHIFYDSSLSIKDIENKGISLEKVIDLFFPFYQHLVGRIILSFEDDCGYPSWIDDIVHLSRNNNLIEFFDRV